MSSKDHPILIAGGGIAGLTAALAFADEGFSVRVFEATPEFAEVGAGLQLSPNAARCLERLGVLRHLKDRAVEPRAVVLHDADTLRRLTEIPLASNQARWGAPYIVAHRADVQRALLRSIQAEPRIQVIRGAQLVDAEFTAAGVRIALAHDGTSSHATGELLVGADGVWSSVRRLTSPEMSPESIFSGMTAWRTTINRQQAELLGFGDLVPFDCVSTFLDPKAHLVAYPISGGEALNLVAITRGGSGQPGWAHTDGHAALTAFFARLPAPLSAMNELFSWTRWPLYSAPARVKWTSTRLALIGDAAHAMLPFAAQGAGMAIEDAVVLATRVAQNPDDLAAALAAYETDRRPRVEKVLARGRLNRTAWHASGPIALGRNLVFKLKGPQSLAADLDWLYGWKSPTK